MRLVSSRSAARRGAVVAVGALAFGGLATLPVLSASASPDSPTVVATGVAQPQAKKTVKKITVTTKKCVTKKKNGKVSCKTIKKTVKDTGKPVTSSKTTKKTTDVTTGPTTTTSDTTPVTHLDNPFAGAKGYVNAEWSEKAKKSGGPASVYNSPTAVWLDRIAAIEGTANSQTNGPMGLADHLDEALKQAAGSPITATFVVYDLPGRDCAALASQGELGQTEIARYKSEYIDPIASIMSNAKYRQVRIIAIIEPDSLPNLMTNTKQAIDGKYNCQTMADNGNYVTGVGYALDKLSAITNVYTYVDAGHHGWLGWDDNLKGVPGDKDKVGVAALFKKVTDLTTKKYASIDGFIVNTANYGPSKEPYITFPISDTDRLSSWIDFNRFADETTFAQGFKAELVSKGWPSTLGMLIDTSRNGWGGSARPTAKGSTIDASRIDKRIHPGNWCNQPGGIGERPKASPDTDVDAYVWIKPPGESDGNSAPVQTTESKGWDRMCDPAYGGNERNKQNKSGAMDGAPLAGAWFEAGFKVLLQNAYPAVN